MNLHGGSARVFPALSLHAIGGVLLSRLRVSRRRHHFRFHIVLRPTAVTGKYSLGCGLHATLHLLSTRALPLYLLPPLPSPTRRSPSLPLALSQLTAFLESTPEGAALLAQFKATQ